MSEKDPAAVADPATPAAPIVPVAAAPAAPAAPATPAPTLAAVAPAGDPAAPATPAADVGTEPPAWRSRLAAGDKDFEKTLARYSDEAAFGKAHRALLSKMSSGEMKRALPENASAEELTSWRKENGIPENEKGYIDAIKLPDGLIIGETDKPLVEDFAKYAHGKSWTPSHYNDALAWYYDNQDKMRAAQIDADNAYMKQAEDSLRTDWQGGDYRRNISAFQNLFDKHLPPDLSEAVKAARLPNDERLPPEFRGQLLGNVPHFIKSMAQISLDIDPAMSLAPAGSTDPAKTLEAELEGIRQKARSDPRGYDADKKLQERQTEIIATLDKVRSRAA